MQPGEAGLHDRRQTGEDIAHDLYSANNVLFIDSLAINEFRWIPEAIALVNHDS